MARRFKGPSSATLVIIAFVILIGLYLFSKLAIPGADGSLGFVSGTVIAAEIGVWGMWIMKAIVLGFLAYLGIIAAKHLTKDSVGKKDIITVIFIVIGVYLFWQYVLVNMWQWNSIDQITFAVGDKLGFFSP